MPKRKTQEEFIQQAKLIHNDLYDYTKVNYINNSTKVIIICDEHGEFLQIPKDHIRGRGCIKCANIQIGNMKRKPFQDIIDKGIELYGDIYDYSEMIYENNRTPIILKCKIHGLKFSQNPGHFLEGYSSCMKCSRTANHNTEYFIERASEIHNNLYNYSKVKYKNNRTKVIIICKKHREFKQTPDNHIIQKQGCPKCKSSKGELKIIEYLDKKQIQYTHQKYCKINNKRMYFDFYLPKQDLYIEFDGEQHFKDSFYGTYESQKKRDELKNKYAKGKLLRISYKEFDNIEDILDKKLKSRISIN